MIYCVSDIHGELDKFERLLTLIQFSENDHLYGGVLCWEYGYRNLPAQNMSIANTCEMLVSVVYCIIRNVQRGRCEANV